MRINIVIDDELMAKAQAVSGLETKRRTVEEALRLLIAVRRQAEVRRLRGALHWEGDLEAMRSNG